MSEPRKTKSDAVTSPTSINAVVALLAQRLRSPVFLASLGPFGRSRLDLWSVLERACGEGLVRSRGSELTSMAYWVETTEAATELAHRLIHAAIERATSGGDDLDLEAIARAVAKMASSVNATPPAPLGRPHSTRPIDAAHATAVLRALPRYLEASPLEREVWELIHIPRAIALAQRDGSISWDDEAGLASLREAALPLDARLEAIAAYMGDDGLGVFDESIQDRRTSLRPAIFHALRASTPAGPAPARQADADAPAPQQPGPGPTVSPTKARGVAPLAVQRFQREIILPLGDADHFKEAVEAIVAEHRACSEWKRLRCLHVESIDENAGLYKVHIGTGLGLESGWEGSVALRPRDGFEIGSDHDPEDPVRWLWSGAVVEVDETAGALYVATEGSRGPTRGDFFVRPFEFTAHLEKLYAGSAYSDLRIALSGRLRACMEGVPSAAAQELSSPWPTSWNVLWGPPGTGKTRLIGERVAELLSDPSERVLVVSTTNDATDQVALCVGRAAGRASTALHEGAIIRTGRGARYRRFADEGLQALLEGDEQSTRQQLDQLRHQLDATHSPPGRARLKHQIRMLIRHLQANRHVEARASHRRVLITTAFHALSLVADRDLVDSTSAPFTTVVIDEAGLISRCAAAALSLLAARRFVLVGDPRQLAPISRMSRVLTSAQSRWLGLSALHHLQPDCARPGEEILRRQYRMHPTIRAAVSAYQYGGILEDGTDLGNVDSNLGGERAIWYVLDEDRADIHRLRADRGEGSRSWVRAHTTKALERLFSAHPVLRDGKGLFLSPFVGQTRLIGHTLRELNATGWRASTVHQQQGAEADFVVFDTVNAGSHCWPLDEWARLINVAASRARHLFCLLATRDEASQPFLSTLVDHLWPFVPEHVGRTWRLREVDRHSTSVDEGLFCLDDQSLGAQLARRKALHPILSAEQERLSRFEMDGKPRLVRGVAGSGKTVVLANWLVQSLLQGGDSRFWVVFANAALRHLLQRNVNEAWRRSGQLAQPPWDRIALHHIDQLLASLEAPMRVTGDERFRYDVRARRILASGRLRSRQAACDAVFMDEAQDLGPEVIQLLALMTKQGDSSDSKSRAINIFYDNAQNVYGRGTPKWADLGIDLRGRSVVMKESFRSTRPITEFAVNVLARLTNFENDSDQRELIDRGLIEAELREGMPWWRVNYNEIEGPPPRFARYADRRKEVAAVSEQIERWIRVDRVQPRDIAVVTMGRAGNGSIAELLVSEIDRRLRPLGLAAEQRTQAGFQGLDRIVAVTTPHSFKGYEAEVVCAVGLDAFHANGQPLAAPLYVALTRARSYLFATTSETRDPIGAKIVAALKEVGALSAAGPMVDDRLLFPASGLLPVLRGILDETHHAWLDEIASRSELSIDPLATPEGEIVAEPVFVARIGSRAIAFFDGASPPRAEVLRLKELGYGVGTVGDSIK